MVLGEEIILGKIPIPNPAVVSRDGFDGGRVMVNCDTGVAISLNQTGALIWDLIDGRRSLDEIAQAFCQRFTERPESARDDVNALMVTLSEDGFIGYDIISP
jgi:hypothetical protein